MPANTDTVNLATFTLPAAQTYTAGVWVYRTANSPQVALKVGTSGIDTHTSTGWKFLKVTFTSTGSDTPQIYPTSAGLDPVYADGLIVVAGNYTGGYFDGDTTETILENYVWTGEPHASTSEWLSREPIYYPRFTDDGTGIPYVSAVVSYGTELLYNSVTVTSPTAQETWENLDSQLKYGITKTEVDTLLANQSAVLALAQFWVAKYGEPEYRFQDLEVSLDGLTPAQLDATLAIDLGDIVEIKFTPNGIGTPIQRYGQVTKIDHSIGVDRHNITFGFGSLQFSYLVLDDNEFGILDSYSLAF